VEIVEANCGYGGGSYYSYADQSVKEDKEVLILILVELDSAGDYTHQCSIGCVLSHRLMDS
jgi:hypothetical protein